MQTIDEVDTDDESGFIITSIWCDDDAPCNPPEPDSDSAEHLPYWTQFLKDAMAESSEEPIAESHDDNEIIPIYWTDAIRYEDQRHQESKARIPNRSTSPVSVEVDLNEFCGMDLAEQLALLAQFDNGTKHD